MNTPALLRIHVGETDRCDHQPLYEAIVLKARERKLAGATVLRSPLGFGASTLLAFVLATTVGLFGVTANWAGWAVWVAAAAEVVAIVAGARLLAADNPLASRVHS